MRPRLALLLVLLAARAASAALEFHVDSVVAGGAAVDGATDCLRTPLGSFKAEPVSKGMRLAVGDEIRCEATGVSIRIVAKDGDAEVGQLVLGADPFHVILAAPDPETPAFAIDLRAGDAFVESDQPTFTDTGETSAATTRTSYRVSVTRGESGLQVRTVVFEGSVQCRSGAEAHTVEQGRAWSPAHLAEPDRDPAVTDDEIRRTALLSASLDVAATALPGTRLEREEVEPLAERYGAVLAGPANADARLDLVYAKLRLGAVAGAAYQLKRVPMESRERAAGAQRVLLENRLGIRAAAPEDLRRAVEQVEEAAPELLQRQSWIHAYREGDRPARGDGDLRESVATATALAQQGDPRKAAALLNSLPRDVQGAAGIQVAAALTDSGHGREARYFAQRSFAAPPPPAADVAPQDLAKAWSAYVSPQGGGRVPDRDWLLLCVEKGLVEQADWGFRQNLRAASAPDARDFYGLGLVATRRRDAGRARASMQRAIWLDDRQDRLDPEQRARAERLAHGDG